MFKDLSRPLRLKKPISLSGSLAAFGTALWCVGALWGISAWVNEADVSAAPTPKIETHMPFKEMVAMRAQEVKRQKQTPATEQANKKEQSVLRPLKQNKTLPRGIAAIYVSDFENDVAALNAWESYQSNITLLNVFQPFAISKNESDAVSLVALMRKVDLPMNAAKDLSQEACDEIRYLGAICMPVDVGLNLQGLDIILELAEQQPKYDVYAEHIARREARRSELAGAPVPLHENVLQGIEPAAGLYGTTEQNIFAGAGLNPDESPFPETEFKEPTELLNASAEDTVAQAAIRAAYDMVRNRYTNAIYQAKASADETASFDGDEALALTQSAVASAADRAFEKFMQENFGRRDFEGRTYEGLQGYFKTAFTHAAASSIKSIGRRFVNDATSGNGFKNFAVRSELLNAVNENVAAAFIETGLAAAKNSQYAFLRNLEVSYKIRQNSKPEYSILTVQPLYSSAGRKHNLFAQAAISYDNDRTNLSGGLGYRYMPKDESYVVGSNLFLDYQRPYDHIRASAGLDFQTSLWGASTNYYKGISDWRDAGGVFQERAQDGFDLELAGRMPFLPALEVFGRAYRWQGFDGEDDTDGKEFRVEYTPVPAFTLQGLWNEEEGRESEFGLGLRYNYTFGAPADYLYDWDEQFRQKSASEYIFRKASRDNTIRVQKRVDPDLVGVAPVIGLLSFSPLNAATGVSVGTDVSFTFEQDVQAGTGNIVFTDLTDGSDNFTIPVTDARVSIVTDTVTIDLSAQLLDFLSDYEMTFAAGVFEDLNGNDAVALNSGDYSFQTVVDPTAGFPAPTDSVPPNTTTANFEDAQDIGSWQTTIDIGAAPDGVIFESGATGQGIAASFGGGNLVFAAGDGASTATNVDSIFGAYPIASIPQGLHHFVFVADPDAPAEIGVYIDGIRVITETIAGSMQSGEWAGTNGAGYGLLNSSIRAGVNSNALSGATLTNNLTFYTNVAPASF